MYTYEDNIHTRSLFQVEIFILNKCTPFRVNPSLVQTWNIMFLISYLKLVHIAGFLQAWECKQTLNKILSLGIIIHLKLTRPEPKDLKDNLMVKPTHIV